MSDTKKRLLRQVEELSEKPISTFTESDEIIEVKFEVNTRLEFLDVVVILGTGGPHLEFRSDNRCINGYWGSERVAEFYDCWREVHDYWEDYYKQIVGIRQN